MHIDGLNERPTNRMVNSFVWTAEEAMYLKAVLRWQATPTPEEKRARAAAAAAAAEAERNRKQPAGEFRILVIGARGTGKTSILTRFGNGTFRGEGEPPDPFYERGCRHPVEINGQTYVVDALEMPSKHLLSNPMLEQALGITEAAVLVYDVRDPASLRLAEGIAEFMRDSIASSSSSSSTTTPARRDYGLLLVGNKSDVDDEDREVSWAQGSKAAAAIRVPLTSGAAGKNTTTTNTTTTTTTTAATTTTNSAAEAIGMEIIGGSCAFLEVSAKTGDNVDKIFPSVGREILRLKRLRREQAERAERARLQQSAAPGTAAPMKKRGLWRMLSTPFFRRQPAY